MAPASPMSPQKRVTRARAAAKKASEDTKKFKINNIAPDASKRKRAEAVKEELAEIPMPEAIEPLRKSARRGATAITGRRIKITPMEDSEKPQQPPPQENSSSHQATKKPRQTRSKKSATNDANRGETETDPAAGLVKLTRQAGTEVKDAVKITAPKLRGRPKKDPSIQDDVIVETSIPPKATRARTGARAADTRILTGAPSQTAVPKKKVTFQDLPECDKENQPVPQKRDPTKGRSARPTSGIRAKPVRRPAATPRANAKQKGTKATAENTNQRVLTPKKVVQIAKSSSPAVSDEDELNGAKTPIKDLSHSPRRNISIAGMGPPAKILDFATRALTSSPVKPPAASTLLSPARRPAPSPFKEALKESPKRGDFSLKLSQAARSTETDQGRDPACQSSTMLLQTPKRVAFETSIFPQSVSKAGRSPFKASLLQSPPKRPISPVKASSTTNGTEEHMTPSKEINVDMLPPNMKVTSHFRASKSPERSSPVHRMTAAELVEEARYGMDFDESIVDIRSPLKLENNLVLSDQVQKESTEMRTLEIDLREDLRVAEAGAHDDAQVEECVAAEESTTTQVEGAEARTTAPASIMLRDQTPVNAASLLFRSSLDGDDDESSEDELQSPIRTFQARTPACALEIEPCLSMANRVANEKPPGFTPLAAQLSGWLASSPEKHPVKKERRQRGIFSPIAAQHIPGEVVIDRQSPATSRVSTGPRLSKSERLPIGDRSSVAPRSSLATSISQTPNKSTYFDDEMVLKDLEEEIESGQAEGQTFDVLQQANSTEGFDTTLAEESTPVEPAEQLEIVGAQQQTAHYEPAPQDPVQNLGSTPDGTSPTLLPKSGTETVMERAENRQQMPETSQESVASSGYGDENLAPATPAAAIPEEILATTQRSCNTPGVLSTSSSRAPFHEVITPRHAQVTMPRFANTVISKVPLRPEGHISPIKIPKKRSRSLSAGPSSVKKTPARHASELFCSSTVDTLSPAQSRLNTPSSAAATPGQQSFMVDDFGDSTLDGIDIDEDDENLPPATPPAAAARSSRETPSRTPQPQPPATPCGVLQGAVVFVDVHTTEGADASGIFVELLSQMGARCVRNWSWNPRACLGMTMKEGTVTPGAGVEGGRIGITHVVYKDGGKRTLEKVRDTEGVVKCVGVGWVLE